MIKRDFTKSNKLYFKQNQKILIAVAVFLLVGVLFWAIFGLNGNFEVSGYNEFNIVVGTEKADNLNDYENQIANIINSYEGKFDNIRIYGEGDDTKFVVRYLKNMNNENIMIVNKLVSEKLDVDMSVISNHVHVNPVINKTDIVYTIVAILLIMVIATIFAYARYNGASVLAIIISTILGNLAFISINSILRLSVGMSYLAMIVILNLLMVYFGITIFENMHKSSWLMSRDYGTAIEKGISSSKSRISLISIGLMLIGLAFILFTPSTVKFASLNLMFMAVVLLAVGLYVIPFVWSVFITKCRQRDYKIKASVESNKQ